MQAEQKTVFVGLSGGVDSSVAALRLIKQGYKVVGVFIKVWHPDFLVCNWEAERLDAMRVAAHLGIPFLTCDAVDAYKNGVAENFIAMYKQGYTPNPDVLCNREVKFGAFLEFAKTKGADFIATGHYAQKVSASDYTLLRGKDENKDQSYFLWTLTQDQLQYILFPVGNSSKDQIRKEALNAKLPTAVKKDSQGVCFLGHIDIPEFLSHYVTLEPGNVLDVMGNKIGSHNGALVFTIGQRHGFTLNNIDTARQPHYVIAKNLEENTLTVATTIPDIQKEMTLSLHSVNWITDTAFLADGVSAQFRYRQEPFPVALENIQQDTCTVRVLENSALPASGQSCVLYKDNQCLGGGIIA